MLRPYGYNAREYSHALNSAVSRMRFCARRATIKA